MAISRRKIINDPVYGFVTIEGELAFDIINHPYFQRLKNIRQLGLTYFVFPGAQHTRFQHSLGAYYLMGQAIDVLKNKGVAITSEEEQGVKTAILLHDVGHGPFSHVLEKTITNTGIHEEITLLFMERLNRQMNGKLDIAIDIFRDRYPKKFLHRLVSGQLDVDRLDYLRRDTYFAGVADGVVGTERIIKMLEVVNDELMIAEKGVLSMEKFFISRRLMFWQVYLHKTVLILENLLIKIIERAKYLLKNGENLSFIGELPYFLHQDRTLSDFQQDPSILERYARIDDTDILCHVKTWEDSKDFILSFLCKKFNRRELYKVEMQKTPFDLSYVESIKTQMQNRFSVSKEEAAYLFLECTAQNHTYNRIDIPLKVLRKDGVISAFSEESELFAAISGANAETRYYIAYPKEILT